jgi:nucleotide-binding universal stress UspA family protein
MGGPGDFIISDPDPAKDRAALAKAEAFIATRFCPVLEAQHLVEWKAECVHFATDADSVAAIVEARAVKIGATAVVLAKHNKSKLKQIFLGSTAKHLVSACTVPVVVLHA